MGGFCLHLFPLDRPPARRGAKSTFRPLHPILGGKLNAKRDALAPCALSNQLGANGFDGVVNSEARAEVPVARKTMGKSQKPILNWLSQPN